MDEATSAADPENQAEIDQAIAELCVGKTVIIIAHRLGMIKHCDRVAIVENETIQACGTHQDMLEECPSYKKFGRIIAKLEKLRMNCKIFILVQQMSHIWKKITYVATGTITLRRN